MEWIPAVFVTFKFVVLVTGMFYAIKWHYDQGKKGKQMRSVLRASGTVAAIFMLSLLGLSLFTFLLIKMLGMDLTTIV